MADNNNTGLIIGGAAIAAAIAMSKKASAAGLPPQDEATIALLQAIAQSMDEMNAKLSSMAGWPEPSPPLTTQIVNAVVPSYRAPHSTRVDINIAGVAIRCPAFAVPPGIQLKVKAGWNNAGIIYVAESGPNAVNPYAAETLIRNEFTTYYIKDAEDIYIAGTNIGDYVILTAEVS